jgi:GT2 family glycosyltransferase
MLDLSIIIVSWNVRDELKDCLHSILNYTSDLRIEIYVVDNNSSDGTCDMVRKDFPSANLIENDTNVGFAKANNQAIRLSSGRYILLLNPDTVIYPKTLMEMSKFMDSHPGAAACSCKILNEKGEVFHFRTKSLSLKDELFRDTILGKALSLFRKEMEDIDYNQTQKVSRVPGICLMVRKEIIEKIGILDERYFLYVEDDDWCRRINKVGDIFIVGNAKIMHLGAKSSDKVKDRAWVVGTGARFMFYRKYYGFILTSFVRIITLFSATLSFLKWKTTYLLGSHNQTVEYKVTFYRACIQACLGIGIKRI